MNLRNVALISGHISPLQTTVDTAQENLISNLSLSLTKLGHDIDIFTRWNNPALPEIIEWRPGIRLIHIKAGPAGDLPSASLLPFMDEFATGMLDFFEHQEKVYNLVHATFWVSAMAAAHLKSTANMPYILTLNEMASNNDLGKQGGSLDAERVAIERHTARHADHISVSQPKDKHRLISEYHIDPAKISTMPGGHRILQGAIDDNTCQRLAIAIAHMYEQALNTTSPISAPSFGMQVLNTSQA